MIILPNKYVLSIKPKNYPVQWVAHCGAYSVKAILSAFNKDTKEHPKEYHSHWFGRVTGTTLGRSYWTSTLNNHGFHAEMLTAKELPTDERINLLKTLLTQNTPVMVRIGNGYWRSNDYSPVLGKLVPHWITLWGYDDTNKLFYVYDSGLPVEIHDKNIPIGNTKRSFEEILRDWDFGTWQFWVWHVSPDPYTYIKVSLD